jgi:CheY-like chemotaxis protein
MRSFLVQFLSAITKVHVTVIISVGSGGAALVNYAMSISFLYSSLPPIYGARFLHRCSESSKRAVEAADNVVHAYDLNMQMPETPLVTDHDTGSDESLITPEILELQRPDIVIEGSGISLSPTGRKRLRSEELDFHPGPPLKRLTALAEVNMHRMHSGRTSQQIVSGIEDPEVINGDVEEYRGGTRCTAAPTELNSRNSSECRQTPPTSPPESSQKNRQIDIRNFIRALIHDAVSVIHPISKDSTQTECGEIVEIITEGPRGEKGRLVIHSETDTEVPEVIAAEEQHLQFALQKIIDNAIKFTDNGTVKVSVKLSRNSQLVDIRVSDTGCGITEESKLHLFKPHFQEDASISRAKDGLGLSLFNAKAHVRKNLGGDITLERSATEGSAKGSEFLIRIPISASLDGSRPNTPRVGTPVPVSHSRSRPSSPPLSTVGNSESLPPAPTSVPIPRRQSLPKVQSPMPAKGSKKLSFNQNLAKAVPLTFLVAEDNVINRQILVNYLKKLGYEMENIIQAYDGVEAVHQYKASLLRPPNKRVNAVLMDLWMPNMDGYEATEKILKIARDKGESLAVMAVTADITSDSLERAKETGMKGFISKPYKVLDIEHLILEHFRSEPIGL